jgi:Flp pilus assembly protein TadD
MTLPRAWLRCLALAFALGVGGGIGDAAPLGRPLRSSPGRALYEAGRYAEARRVLEAEVAKDPRALEARLDLGLTYRATGQTALAQGVWNRFFDDYEQGHIDKRDARQLTYVALAARYLGSIKDANDTFRDAVEADPHGPAGARANIAWAELFLDKYDAGHAEVSLDEALKVLPGDPDALALLARVKLEQNYDVDGAEKALAQALKTAPRHRPSLAVKARIALESARRDEAQAICGAILGANPEDVDARALAAAAAYLSGDAAGYRAERDHVLSTNPHASGFFHAVAEQLVRERRYKEANELEEQALKADPKDPIARAAIGANLLRLGEDRAGLEALQAAWQGDPYNVRSYNLLSLFEEVIPKHYVMVDGPRPFRLRVPTAEREVLLPTVTPLLSREYAELSARYGFRPEEPITLELFTDPDHFAVRTVGLPNVDGLLGVTFGKVVTAVSPSSGKFNWGMTLWHELAHVFAIQLSRSRVPRWFTEGLSEYETWRHDPTWTRRTSADLYRALEAGQLLPATGLDRGFTHARDLQHIVVAYHQAAREVSFLAERWGFPKIVEALKLFGEGREVAEVLSRITGLSPEAFDRAFRDDLKRQLSAYQGTFFVRSADLSDLDTLKERATAHPEDLRSKGLYALALVRGHQGEEAMKIVGASFERWRTGQWKPSDGQAREQILASAEIALQRKDREAAKALYRGLIEVGGDGYDARYGLGRIAIAAGDAALAKVELELAAKYDPDRAEPHLALAELYDKKQPEDELRELEAAARLDVMNGAVPLRLVERYERLRRWPQLLEAGQRALDIAPFDAQLRGRIARAYAELGRAKEARAQLTLAHACRPSPDAAQALDDVAARLGVTK